MNRIIKAAIVLFTTFLLFVLLAAVSFRKLPADFPDDCSYHAMGHPICVRLLIWLGADPNYMTGGGSAMHVAAFDGDVGLMQFLVDHGADVNAAAKFGVTPLYEARENHQSKAEHFLLTHGANPDTIHIKVP